MVSAGSEARIPFGPDRLLPARQWSCASRTTASSTFVTHTRGGLVEWKRGRHVHGAVAAERAGRDSVAVFGAEPEPVDVVVAVEPRDLELDLRSPARGSQLGRGRDTGGRLGERDVLSLRA